MYETNPEDAYFGRNIVLMRKLTFHQRTERSRIILDMQAIDNHRDSSIQYCCILSTVKSFLPFWGFRYSNNFIAAFALLQFRFAKVGPKITPKVV